MTSPIGSKLIGRMRDMICHGAGRSELFSASQLAPSQASQVRVYIHCSWLTATISLPILEQYSEKQSLAVWVLMVVVRTGPWII